MTEGDTADRVPLCVDLDGTLIHNDVAWMALRALLRRGPGTILGAFRAAMGGRAPLKRFLASNAPLEPASLHYNQALIEVINQAKASGRAVILATAADRLQAERIAQHVGLFDEVVSSDGEVNLKAAKKAEALLARFGLRGFDYAGDRYVDLPVWKCARRAILARADGRRPGFLLFRARIQGIHLEPLAVPHE